MLPQAGPPPSTSSLPPYYQMPAQPSSLPGAPVEPQVQPYQANVYPTVMAPPQTYPPHLDSTSASMQGRYGARPEESQSPRHQASGSASGASPVVSNIQPATPQPRSRAPVSDHRSPGTSGGATTTSAGGKGRRSPLVLMSGPTGPSGYEPTTSTSTPSSSHPKNLHAQTLILGECLRPEAIIHEGPAILIISRTILEPVQRQRRRHPRALRGRLVSPICRRIWTERQVLFRHHHSSPAQGLHRRISRFSRRGRLIAG
jgi:hypothetical protein